MAPWAGRLLGGRPVMEVVGQHVEETAMLWETREVALRAPHYLLADLCRLDDRIDAHVDDSPRGWPRAATPRFAPGALDPAARGAGRSRPRFVSQARPGGPNHTRVSMRIAVVGACLVAGGCGGGSRDPAAVDSAPPPAMSDAAAPPVAAPPADGQPPPAADSPPPDQGAEPDASPPEVAPPIGDFPLDQVKAARPSMVASLGTHTEGPSWRAGGDLVFAADGMGLLRLTPDGKVSRYHPGLAPVGSYALADGSVLLCEKTHIVVQLFADGKVGVIADQYQGQKIGFCNDITVDGQGNIYFTEAHAGVIYRIAPTGEVVRVASGYNYPNGIEVDPQSKFVYFVTGSRLLRVALPATGNSFPAPEAAGTVGADGMAFDVWGNLWVAAGGRIVVFDPVKRTSIVSIDGGGGTTNLTFGGPGRDALYVTLNGGLARIPVGARGFLHPGAARYAIKAMLDLPPAN